MGYPNKDPFHQPLLRLPCDWPRPASKDSLRGQLVRLEMRRLWIAAIERGIQNPPPNCPQSSIDGLTNMLKWMRASTANRPTRAQKLFITNMDWKKPCAEPGCDKLAYFMFGPKGWCRNHEGGYWHARRVWDGTYSDKNRNSAEITAAVAEKDRRVLHHARCVRNQFRRKKRRK